MITEYWKLHGAEILAERNARYERNLKKILELKAEGYDVYQMSKSQYRIRKKYYRDILDVSPSRMGCYNYYNKTHQKFMEFDEFRKYLDIIFC